MAATTAAATTGSSGASLGAGTLPSGASSSSATSMSRSQQQQQRRRMVCSSIAVVPATTDVSTLTSHLFSSSVRGAERLRERDLYCRRADDVHPHTTSVEAGDNSFAPVRRARQANRLIVRRSAEGEGRTTMRLATPARPKREQDLFSLQTLLEVPLLVDEGETPLDRDSRQVLQVVGALGWVPDHRTVRVGHRFVLRQGSEAEGSVHLEVLLFQLYASSTEAEGLVPLSSSTHILQAISSTPLPLSNNNNNNSKARPQQEPGELDASTLAERVIRDMRAIHDDLRGLVVFRPDD